MGINIKIDECMKGVNDQRKDIDEKLEKLETDMTDIKEDVNDVCEENFGKIKNDIENILKENKENCKDLIERNSKLNDDLQSLDNRHKETVEKLNGINVLATNIEVYVKAQEEKLEKQKEQDLSAVESKLAVLKEEITTVNNTMIQIGANGDTLGNDNKNLQANFNKSLDNQSQTDQAIREDLEAFKAAQRNSLADIDNLNAEQAEKIKALEEASMHHFERAQAMDTLNTRVSQLDEMRQQSEAKAKDEVDASLARSTTIINEFKTDIENKIQNINIQYQNNLDNLLEENNLLKNDVVNLKDDLTSLKNLSIEIKNTQSENSESTVKEMAGLLEKVEDEIAKLNELRNQVSDLDDSVTTLSPDITKNAQKIVELDAFKGKIEPLTINLSQEITALKTNGQNASERAETLKEYSAKLDEAIKIIQENQKKTAKELESKKNDSETLGEKIEDINDKLDQLNTSSTEFKTFNINLEEKFTVLNAKLDGVDSDNKNNIAEIVNIKEANFAQQEKVKFVEALSARVDVMDEERKKSEALQIDRNEDMIAKNATAIQLLQDNYDARIDGLEKENKQQAEVDKDLANLIEKLRDDNDTCSNTLKDLNVMIEEQQNVHKNLLTTSQKDIEEKMTNYENNLQLTYNVWVDKQEEDKNNLKKELDALNEGIKQKANLDDIEARLLELKKNQESVSGNMKDMLDQLTSNNTNMINIKIDECMKGVNDQRKDIDEKLEKLETDMTDIKEDVNDVCEEQFGKIKEDMDTIVKQNKENCKDLIDRNSILHDDLQSLDKRHIETVEKLNGINVLATNIEVYVKAQEEKLEKQKEQDLSAVESRLVLMETLWEMILRICRQISTRV